MTLNKKGAAVVDIVDIVDSSDNFGIELLVEPDGTVVASHDADNAVAVSTIIDFVLAALDYWYSSIEWPGRKWVDWREDRVMIVDLGRYNTADVAVAEEGDSCSRSVDGEVEVDHLNNKPLPLSLHTPFHSDPS